MKLGETSAVSRVADEITVGLISSERSAVFLQKKEGKEPKYSCISCLRCVSCLIGCFKHAATPEGLCLCAQAARQINQLLITGNKSLFFPRLLLSGHFSSAAAPALFSQSKIGDVLKKRRSNGNLKGFAGLEMTLSDREPEELKAPVGKTTLIPRFIVKSQDFQFEAIRQLAVINFSMLEF